MNTLSRMMRDAQVNACVRTKQFSVLSETADVFPGDGTAAAERAADAVRAAFARIPGGVSGIVSGALDAIVMGYAVGELVWDGVGGLSKVLWHDPRRFVAVADDVGDLEAVDLPDRDLRFDAARFVWYAYNARYGNPYGESDLTPAFRYYTQKDQVQRMWMMALDRFGAPTPVAYVPHSFGQARSDALANQLGNLQTDTAIVVENDVRVTYDLEHTRTEPAKAYDTASQYLDAQIARAILGQDLTTNGTGGGSYALGKVHADVLTDRVQMLRSEIAEVVLTEQVARRICLYACGAQVTPPVVRFPNLSAGDMQARAALVDAMLKGRVVAPEEAWLRAYLGLPAQSSVATKGETP